MKILVIDNYDSFTFNLVHYLEGLGCDVCVWRNDEIDFSAIATFDKIVLSPGPGLPIDAGDMNKLIKTHIESIPILGVCLGFQALVEHFGGEIYNQNEVKHGVAERCNFNSESKLFLQLPPQFKVGLYHSWAAKKKDFPSPLTITAETEEGTIMAFEHTTLPICGVQFHPESILTENGKAIVQNFIGNFN